MRRPSSSSRPPPHWGIARPAALLCNRFTSTPPRLQNHASGLRPSQPNGSFVMSGDWGLRSASCAGWVTPNPRRPQKQQTHRFLPVRGAPSYGPLNERCSSWFGLRDFMSRPNKFPALVLFAPWNARDQHHHQGNFTSEAPALKGAICCHGQTKIQRKGLCEGGVHTISIITKYTHV
jgi:hypothetical protein